jgi:hypothetical protein
MGRAYSTNGEKMNAYRILVGMPEGKRPLRRPRHVYVCMYGIGHKTGPRTATFNYLLCYPYR